MYISNMMGLAAGRRSGAGQKTAKTAVKPKTAAAEKTAPAPKRDRLELQFNDVLQAEKNGYIEVGGKRFAVTADMASQMRAAYEEMKSRNEAKMAYEVAKANAEKAKEQSELMKEQGDAMAKAMEIARRLAKGGRIPGKDEEFLLNFSQEMYMAAKLQGMLARQHEKYDSVLGDEEEEASDGSEAEAEDGGTRATVEATLADGAVESVSVGEASAGNAEG